MHGLSLFFRFASEPVEGAGSGFALFGVPVHVTEPGEDLELHEGLDLFVKRDDGGEPAGLFARAAEDGSITFLASEPVEDRAKDIIAPPWQLGSFRANPVMPFAHDYDRAPVGKWKVKLVEKRLIATASFDESPLNPLGQLVAHQYRAGFLNAVSVGIRSGEIIHRSRLAEDHEYRGDRGFLLTRNELLEISAVPVPMLQTAVAQRGTTAAEEEATVRGLGSVSGLADLHLVQRRLSGLATLLPGEDLDAVRDRSPGPDVADAVLKRMQEDAGYRDTVRRLLAIQVEPAEAPTPLKFMLGG